MGRLRRLIRGLYFWSLGFLVTFVLFSAVALYEAWTRFRRQPRDGRMAHRIASVWGRTMIQMMPGWRVTVEGEEHIPPETEAVVIVANHESMSDIWAMYYLGIQFRWLSKAEVFKLPLIGQAMRWAEYVPVVRTSRQSGVEAMRQSAQRIRGGVSMFFFPEGTRSADGRLAPFKVGAFKLARDEGVRVLPIAIHGAGDLFPKGSALPGDEAHIRIRVLPPMAPPAVDQGTIEEYAATVRSQIAAAHTAIL